MALFRCGGFSGAGGDSIAYIAPEYDSSKSYNINDVVLMNGETYKYNGAQWVKCKLMDLVDIEASDDSSYLENLSTEYISGTTTGSIFVNCSSDAGLWKGSATDTFVAWTNNKGKSIKFVPISGIVETEKVLANGESLHISITANVTKTDSEFESWRQPGSFGNYVNASKAYSFYIIY